MFTNRFIRFLLVITALSVGYLIYTLYSTPVTHRYHFLHFGTTIQITTGLGEPKLSDNTIDEIDTLLKTLHFKWHPWRDGELKDLNNNLATLNSFATNSEIIHIIQLAQNFYVTSDGYFNPAIGKLVAYWGFHSDNPATDNISRKNKLVQDNFDLKNFIHHLPNPNNIIINTKTLTLQNTNPNLQLDLSGFIKADAMLKIKNILLTKNIHNALINIGGDILVLGNKSQTTHWQIGLNLNNQNNKLVKVTLLDSEAIATSGVYARFKQDQKTHKILHHIINPKTGQSAQGFYNVTVIHQDPYLCDAAATALLVAGERDYLNVAKSMGVEKFILVGSGGEVIVSDEMKLRIRDK